MVNASRVNPTIKNERCYVGIFQNTNTGDTSKYYFGALYFLKYYTYFEVKDSLVYPMIGTGLKNPDANILQSEYNRSYDGYKRKYN